MVIFSITSRLLILLSQNLSHCGFKNSDKFKMFKVIKNFIYILLDIWLIPWNDCVLYVQSNVVYKVVFTYVKKIKGMIPQLILRNNFYKDMSKNVWFWTYKVSKFRFFNRFSISISKIFWLVRWNLTMLLLMTEE